MDKSNQNAPPKSETYLREIRDAVVGIHDMLQKSQAEKEGNGEASRTGMHQHMIMDDVYISRDVVLQQLRISATTLAKWRSHKCIKYRHRGSRLVEYSFIGLMNALTDNKLTARGFNPFAAYKHMLEWYRNNIEGSDQK